MLDIIVFPNRDFTNNAERTILRLEALRAQRFAREATIIFAPESNLSHYASAMNDLLMRKKMFDRNLVDEAGRAIAPVDVRLCNYVMYRMSVEDLGVLTTRESKRYGTNRLHTLVRNHRLLLWECASDEALDAWRETLAQMANWCMTPNRNGKFVFGANGLKTDHIMALIVGVYAIFQWEEGKACDISLKYESTCCLCNCPTGLCGRRTYTKFIHRV